MKIKAEYKERNGDSDCQEIDVPDDSSRQDILDNLRPYVGRWFGHVKIEVTVDGKPFDY